MTLHSVASRAFAALALAGLLALPAQAQKWGTVTGKVIWDDGKAPANEKASIDKDKAHCESKGKILRDELIVDPKTKGVKNVVLWLIDASGDQTKKIPVSQKAKEALGKSVTIDQPCCVFEPRMVPIVEGQKLIVVNSEPIAHNIKIDGGADGPNINPLMPPKSKYAHEEYIKPRLYGIQFSCSIHAWMKGWLVAVPNPYVAVSKDDGSFTIKDAPAGKYMLVAWHEKAGWILMDPKTPKLKGKVIEIKPEGGTDLGKIGFKLPKDDE